MEIEFTIQAQEDLAYWKRTGNNANLKRTRLLLENILETPFKGIEKPEALKHNLSGKWSRRVSQSDRIVYQVIGDVIFIHSLRGHYE